MDLMSRHRLVSRRSRHGTDVATWPVGELKSRHGVSVVTWLGRPGGRDIERKSRPGLRVW